MWIEMKDGKNKFASNGKFLRTAGILLLVLLLMSALLLFVSCDETEDDSGIHASVTDDFKTEYYVGEPFVAVGGLKTYFDIDYYAVVPVTEDMVTGFDTSRPGTIIVTVTHGDFIATVPITIRAVKALSLSLDAEHLPEIIYENKTFPSDITFSAVLSDGTTLEDVVITPSMLGGFNSSVIGSQKVTVSYLGATASFVLEIKKDVRVEIELVGAQRRYGVKEELNIAGAYLNVRYESGTVDQATLTKNLVTGFSTALGGDYKATITYHGLTCDYDYTVIREPQSFRLTRDFLPSVFEKGDPLPQTGKGVLTYNDGTEEEIALTADNFPSFDTSIAGEKTVDVIVAGQTDTYTYTVLPSIVSATPYGYTSAVGQKTDFDRCGGLLVVYEEGAEEGNESLALWNEGSTKEEIEEEDGGILQNIVTGPLRIEYRTSVAGDAIQKIYFRTRVIEFTVHVYDETERATAVNGISIAGAFRPIVLGEDIDVTGIQVGIDYKYLSYDVVDCKAEWVTAEMPESIESDYVDVPVTVSYLGAEAIGSVRVLSADYAAKATYISVSGFPIPLLYSVGDELLLENLSMYVIFGGGYASDTVEVLPAYVTGFDTATAGEKTMTVSYAGGVATIEYRVLDEEDKTRVTDVAIVDFAPKLFVGDTIEAIPPTYEVSLTLGYGYGHDTASLADDDVTLTGGPFDEVGSQPIVLNCRGYEKTLYVTVYPAADRERVTAIAVISDDVTANVGVRPDLSQVLLAVVYGHGYRETQIPLSSSGVAVDYDSLRMTEPGLSRTTITYAGCSCALYVNFVSGDSGNVLQRIEVEAGSKTAFEQGDEFGGVNLILHYKNGTERISVTAEMVPDFDTQTIGEHTVTVSYGGRGVLYTYTVSAAPEQQEEGGEEPDFEEGMNED